MQFRFKDDTLEKVENEENCDIVLRLHNGEDVNDEVDVNKQFNTVHMDIKLRDDNSRMLRNGDVNYAHIPEGMSICPYNPSHIVKDLRFPAHLLKCKQNHPDVKFVTCHFNARHLILEEKIDVHHKVCPNRINLNISSSTPNSINSSNLRHQNNSICSKNEQFARIEEKPIKRPVGRGALRFMLFEDLQLRGQNPRIASTNGTNADQNSDSGMSDSCEEDSSRSNDTPLRLSRFDHGDTSDSE